MAAGAMLDMPLTTVMSVPPPTIRKVSFGVSILGSALRSVAAMTVATGSGGVAVHVLGVTDAVLGAATTYWPGLTTIEWPPDVNVTEPACPIFAIPTCR